MWPSRKPWRSLHPPPPPHPQQQPSGLSVCGELAGRSMFIDFIKESLFQGKCHRDKVTVCLNELVWWDQWAPTIPPAGWGSAIEASTPRPPTLQGPFSCPVAVANIVILGSPPQRPREKKSTFTPAGHHECFRKPACKQSVTFWPASDTLEQQTKQPGWGY